MIWLSCGSLVLLLSCHAALAEPPQEAVPLDTAPKMQMHGHPALAHTLRAGHITMLGDFLSDEEPTGSPDLMKVAVTSIVSLLTVLALDAIAHLAESFIEDDDVRARVDSLIDGAAAFSALVISNTWYSIISEYIMTQEYATGRFPSTMFLILCCRIMIVCLSVVMMVVMKERLEISAVRSALVPGFLGSTCSFFGETSLLYLAYPVVALFKSSSIVPTMVINTLVNGEVQSLKMYAIAAFISVCVAGFCLASHDDNSAPHMGKGYGMLMISASVLAGSLSSTTQKTVFSKYPSFSSTQMMLVCGLFTCAVSTVGVACSTGFFPLFTFLAKNPECMKHIAALGLSGAMGYFFIFYTVSTHGPVALTIMMVVKQVVSIILSAILYEHRLNAAAKLCACGTFAGVLASTYVSQREKAEVAAHAKQNYKNSVRSMLRVTSSFRDLVNNPSTEQAYGSCKHEKASA